MKPSSSKNEQIHDAFFKEVMADVETAIAFFEAFLPEVIKKTLRLDTLTAVQGSFVGQDLKAYVSDMLFEVQQVKDGAAFLSLLVEHKGNKERFVFLQLNQYQAQGFMVQRKNEPKKPLQPIIPVLFYHGKEQWDVAHLRDLIPNLPQSLRSYIADFDIHLIALNELPDAHLLSLQHGLLRSAMLLQKHHKRPDQLLEHIVQIFTAIQPYFKENKSIIHLVYLFKNVEIAPIILQEKLSQLPPPIKNKVMSTYDMLIKEGEIKGIAKGKEKTAQNMILKGFDNQIIREILNVSDAFIEKIRKEL